MAIPPSKTSTPSTQFANKFPDLPNLTGKPDADTALLKSWWNDTQLVLNRQFNQAAVKIDSKADKP